ncbi:S10 family peptidase [Granulicella mallensis]|uniref:Peptidase S10 serine carboxypeptidase n=1 Tax=Granulicella mallensis (strain ATCC BAA-1857 / DSM 23137 / MP5ACTX8) TaxID=682795 RepID=G8NXH5_GRAMM|nr:peptidase S10 [Granulicella mallensis]AEU38970.1 peptidase S10 serine carboxypeptidase [Granulicella mallensis MP5ACTX8]
MRPTLSMAGLPVCALCLFAFAAGVPSLAQDHHGNDKTAVTTTTTVASETEKKPVALPADSITEGSVVAGGKTIAYKAVAGMLTVGSSDAQDATLGLDGKLLPDSGIDLPAKPEDQPATARIFYTAYFAKGSDTGTRPVVFFYNGGPGSATMYLRMGSMSPVRVLTPDTQHQFGGPYKTVPNQYSLLDTADLVFIDAPGTGYSRVMGKDAFKSFYGIDQDAGAFDRFIRRFLTKYDRWSSPKFLFGESYGTTRDAVLSATLQQHGVDLNGVVLLSQILSFDNSADGSDGNPGTDNGFFLALPSFAATAWYHHKIPNQPAELEPWLHEVEQYSIGDYASALLQGADLDPTKKAAVAAKLESYTGVPQALWLKANLRLTGGEFSKYLQDGSDTTTGRLDSRYEGPHLDPLSASADYDPFTESIEAAFMSAMNTYAHQTLKFGENMTYKSSAREPGWTWDMKHNGPGGGQGSGVNVSADLAYTMKVNPKMHVLLMGGYFDLGTLYFAATYEMKHLPLPTSLQKNISYKFFPTGHMVYVNEDALHGLHDRTAAFIKENEGGGQ